MTSPWARRAALLITATVTVGVLAACTPTPTPAGPGSTSPSGTTAPTATPTPTPTLSSLDTTAPTPLVNLSCDDLTSTAEVQKAYPGVPLVATTDLADGDLAGVGNALPVSYYVRADGGVECLWDTKPVDNYQFTGKPNPSFEINVVFNAGAAWAAYQKGAFFTGNNYGACDVGICQTDDFVNNTWIDILELEPNQNHQSDVVQAVEKSAINAVKSGGVAAALPAAPAGTLALGTQCPDFIADSDVQSALGSSGSVVSSTPTAYLEDESTFSTWDAAQSAMHDKPCVWKSGGKKIGALNWIPAGAWAWKEAQTHSLIDGPAQPLTVAGLHSGDGAWVRCDTAQTSCIADLVIGGNWIEASLAKTGPSSKMAAITAIATSIVAKLG